MAFNQIQFQHGMSIPEVLPSIGSEAHCAEAIKAARWAEGLRCPRCSSSDHYVVGRGARKLVQCNGGRHQTALIAGSLMTHTKLPLTTWFLVIYVIYFIYVTSQAKTGLSALALKRQRGVAWRGVAWRELFHGLAAASEDQPDDGALR